MEVSLNRPKWFTKEHYLQLKSQGVTDRHIYTEMLYVSRNTFSRFKRELGVLGVGNIGGHNRKVDHEKARDLYRKGYSIRSIANRYNAAYVTVYKVVMY